VLNAGASDVFNHRDPNYVEAIKTKYPSGFDVCLEMLASSNLGIDLTLMSQNGRVVVVGSRGPVEINPRDIMSKELQVSGVMLFAASSLELQQTSSFLDALLRNGQINPLASLVLPLEEAAEAHREVISRSRVSVGNIVLLPPPHEAEESSA
jgi:NADPH:quinone reductase